MGWQDRSYYRDYSSGTGNPFMWLLTGSVPLFRAFGIHVRAHASLLLTTLLIVIFGIGNNIPLQERLICAAVLFLIVLLHEFGHCFAARAVRGEADEIIMHPLGGLALARPPHRPWPTFVTVAGGPFVNVLICVAAGAVLWAHYGFLPWNPFSADVMRDANSSFWVWGRWIYWTYWTSWMLLVFNLLPIFPLDGGQMLQSILWPKMGYYRSMNFACMTGMIGAVIGGTIAMISFHIGLAIMAVFGFMYCLQMRRMLQAEGPAPDEPDYSSSVFEQPEKPRHRHLSKRLLKKAQKREAREIEEQARVDQILAKVSAHGMASLSWWERRTLRKATQHQRQKEMELKEVGPDKL